MATMTEQLPGYGPPTPVPIFQWKPEFETLLELYRRSRPARVLEVGTYHGGTLYHWLQNANAGTKIVSVDSYAVGVDNRHLYADWTPDNVSLTVIAADCHAPDTIAQVAGLAPFDWLFIDAGHYYQEVKDDWDNYSPLVLPGGIVCFHDILPPNEVHPEIEVAQLWDEIRADHLTLEIVQDRDAYWGGIGIVLL